MSKYKWEFPNNTIGVYKITNKINNDCYIGASKNVMNRWRQHFSNYKNQKCKDYNTLLYINIRKYGLENFTFELLEQCLISELNIKERYYVKLYNPKYNMTPGGKGGHVNEPENFEDIIYDLKYSSSTIKALAKKYNCCVDKINYINSGKVWYKDNLNYPIRTPEQIRHKANSACEKKIIQFDKEGNYIQEWESIMAFCRTQGQTHDTFHISAVCKGKRKTACGYIWKYKEDYEKNKA